MNVDADVVIIAMIVMTIASTIQASVGFGANMLAAPVFALLDPDLVPGPIFVAAGVLTFATAWREREGVDREVVTVATAGRIPASILGAFVLAAVDDRSLQLMVGVTIMVAVILSSGVIRIPERRATFFGAGFVSGFGATTAAIGGPPVALTLQHRNGRDLRATMGAYFAIGSVLTLPAIAAAGRLGWAELAVGACLIPAALLGFVFSGPLRSHVDAGRVRPLVLGLAAIAAVVLIVRTI
ncbi:MAG: sulfite exporter TauE/SafE family protein [Acidimicrobiales bacterium]|nr:sulfite exporter TauE/SafE family protein [Acidimicrobiales bacterium]